METSSPTSLATDHELFVGDLIDQMRKQRQEKSRSYRNLPYFQHLGSEEVFEALDRVKQANLLQMQQKMQKDCSYLQHMDDMSLEGRNAESVRKRVQEGKLQGGFRQIQSGGHTTVCGCLDCQLRLGNKQFNSSFQYEQSKEVLAQKVQRSRLSFLGAAWHCKPMLTMHLCSEGGAPDTLGTALQAAVLRGDADLLRLLCSRAECDTSTTWSGVSALDLAVARGFEEGGEVLLQHGAPLRHFQHETLVEAIDRGSMLLLRALLQQLGVYTHQGLYMTEAACEALNSAGADGNTPLHMACLLPDKEAAVKILIAHNAEMNVENDEGMTPLDCCVQTQNRAAWRALRHSAGGQAKHRHYEAEHRSLRSAVASNCLFLVRNVHLRQDDEKKVGKLGADHGELLHLALATPAVSEDMVQYLVEQGADVNTLLDGFSVLDLCLQQNRIGESLLGKHARLSRYQDFDLCMAAKQGLSGLCRYLANTARKGGKDGVNHREAGCLPLHLAACRGHVDAVKVLLKANSNVHEQTDNGRTALDLACDALSMLDGADSAGEDEVFARLCRTIDALLARSCRLKEFKDESQLDRAREFVQREAGTLRKDALDQKEATKEDSGRAEARKVAKRRRDDGDEAVKAVEREVRAKVVEEEKKTDGYKESEKLAKKVAEAREVLQASWRGDGEKLPEYLSSKYYQIRIDVLRRKIQEKDQQIEEALKKMDFAEEDYLWLLRKRMRDLRLKHHPDKITDRQPTEEDYKFYERITKAYDVLCTKEERDKYLELSNHVEWLQQRGEVDEANLVEKAIYDMESVKKAKKTESKEEESAIPPREHVERAKKKLQERRDEEMWDKAGDKIRALTLGTPNKCKAPVVTSQRFSDRLEQCWIDIEWLCKCASATTERIEYELRVQAIDKGAEEWAEVYHGWESSVAGLGPFPVGSYEFMVRARNSIGWGEWSDVVVISLDDPKWERQQKKEAEQQVLEKQARSLQAELQSILDEFQEMQGENKLTIHRASNLLFHLQAESKRGRMLRAYLPDQQLLRRADSAVQLLERWRDRKEAFAEWKQSLSEMRSQLLQEQLLQADALDLEHFLGQDEHYFGSLSPAIRNLIVQTLLGLDAKQVFKKLTTVQKERITSILRRGGDLGRAVMPSPPEDDAKKASGGSSSSTSCASKSQTIFTKHQIDQLMKLAELFSVAQARMVPRSFRSTGYPCGDSGGSEEAPPAAPLAPSASGGSRGGSDFGGSEEVVVSLAPQTAPVSEPAVASNARAVPSISDDRDKNLGTQQDKSRIVSRTVHVTGLPCGKTSNVTRGDLVSALRPFAEVDGARVGTLDALVRFSTPEQAQKALSALERGVVSLRRSILSGTAAPADLLSEEALLRAGGRAPPEKRPPAPAAAAAAAATAAATATAAVAAQKAAQALPGTPQRAPPQDHSSMSSSAVPEDRYPVIKLSQMVSADGTTSMFECPLCSGVAWQPKVAMCCQKVFCTMCLDRFLQTSTCCPQCNVAVVVKDGSTGGCSEQRVKRLDRTSPGVQGVLWRVYANLRIRCAHSDCAWTGNIVSYGEHLEACSADKSKTGKQETLQPAPRPVAPSTAVGAFSASSSPPMKPAAAPSKAGSPAAPQEKSPEVVGNHVVVWEHRATDESQLSLRVGDRVCVTQVAAHGWVFGYRILAGPGGNREGWFPTFCLPESRQVPPAPRPQQSPPPSAPPVGSTQVARDYEANDTAQLSVKAGELVFIRQKDSTGWTFVVKVNPQAVGQREGWVPDWLVEK